MKYYWSCWFTKEELIEAGADSLICVYYTWHELVSTADSTYHYVFRADSSFPVFAKIKFDRSVAEIPTRYYNKLVKGERVRINQYTKVGNGIHLCDIDF